MSGDTISNDDTFCEDLNDSGQNGKSADSDELASRYVCIRNYNNNGNN